MIEIQNVTTVFSAGGSSKLLKLVEEGTSKNDLLKEQKATLALNRINLKISTGEIFVIMGLSGSGKSTLARHLNLLVRPTSGKIFIEGHNILDYSKKEVQQLRRHNISMVFQRFGLLPNKNVLGNVLLGLQAQKTNKKEAHERALHWIDFVGLKGYEKFFPSQLSGGMQQRVGLARALATEAKILIMDEAFSALDPIIRFEMQSQLLEIQKKLRRSIIFITHDLNEAMRIGDRIAILKDGSVVQVGTPDEIRKQPKNKFVESFVKNIH